MWSIVLILASTTLFAWSRLTAEEIKQEFPFCLDSLEEKHPLVEDFSLAIGGKPGREFISCAMKYWKDAFFGNDHYLGGDIKFLLNPNTREVQSALVNGGFEIYPSYDSKILNQLKQIYLKAPNGTIGFEYFTDEFFAIGGVRVLRSEGNLVLFWHDNIVYGKLQIEIPAQSWLKEEDFIKNVTRIVESYDSGI